MTDITIGKHTISPHLEKQLEDGRWYWFVIVYDNDTHQMWQIDITTDKNERPTPEMFVEACLEKQKRERGE